MPGDDVRRAPVGDRPGAVVPRLIAEHADARTRSRGCSTSAPATAGSPPSIRRDLPPDATVVCWDVNYRSEDLATPTGPGIVRTAVQPDGPFDIVLALDVLEHVDDDEPSSPTCSCRRWPRRGRAAQRAGPPAAVLRPRPDARARPALPAVGSFRQLVARHLEVVRAGSVFASLVPPRALDRRAASGSAGTGEQRPASARGAAGRLVTGAVTAVLDADAALGSLDGGDPGSRCRGCRRGSWPAPADDERHGGDDRRPVLRRGRTGSTPTGCASWRCLAGARIHPRRRRIDGRHARPCWPRSSPPTRATFAVATLADQPRQGARPCALGLLAALDAGAEIVGYYDADLATPPAEMARLVDVLRGDPTLARRPRLAGRPARHGHRPLAARGTTSAGCSPPPAASILDMTVYDTQCGAKVLRDGPALRAAARPRRSTAAGRSTSSCSVACTAGSAAPTGLPAAAFLRGAAARRGTTVAAASSAPVAALGAWDLVGVARALRPGRADLVCVSGRLTTVVRRTPTRSGPVVSNMPTVKRGGSLGQRGVALEVGAVDGVEVDVALGDEDLQPPGGLQRGRRRRPGARTVDGEVEAPAGDRVLTPVG